MAIGDASGSGSGLWLTDALISSVGYDMALTWVWPWRIDVPAFLGESAHR